MKKLMLMACGIGMSFLSTTLLAQSTYVIGVDGAAFSDTLVVKLKGSNKILITGRNLDRYYLYGESADRIKTSFLSDIDAAWKNNSVSHDARDVYYFVYDENKRRLKAEQAEYTDSRVDVAYEIKRMELDLPKFRYAVYDIKAGIEMQIFMDNPDNMFTQLSEVSLKQAIDVAVSDKKLIRKAVKLEVNTDTASYSVQNTSRTKHDFIELVPYFGAGVIGNTISPVIGGQLELRLNNKYGVSRYRIGLDVTGFAFTQKNKGEISALGLATSYDLRFMFNANAMNTSKPYWFGVQGGIMKSDLSTFNNALKFGFVTETSGGFRISFDLILPKKDMKDPLYGLTVKTTF